MRSTAGRALAVAGLVATLISCAVLGAAAQDTYQKDGRAAAAFCARPASKSLKCGLASAAEIQATTAAQCPYCYDGHVDVPKLPAELHNNDESCNHATKVISLACKGRAVVRTVFKITDAAPIEDVYRNKNCSDTRLTILDGPSKTDQPVRCVLQLPSGPGSEEERALRAKEGPCYICGFCATGTGCPANPNTWYSDTVLTAADGCDFDRSTGYAAQRASVFVYPKAKIRLAKFEVCNDPGCFNAAYEDAKLKGARKCVKGVCPKP